jgi:hypothetical protein
MLTDIQIPPCHIVQFVQTKEKSAAEQNTSANQPFKLSWHAEYTESPLKINLVIQAVI